MAAGTKVGVLSSEYSIIIKIKSPLYLKMKEAGSKARSLLKKLQNIVKLGFFELADFKTGI